MNNHEIHRELVKVLDPALGALIRDLKERGQLDRTVVLCAGEFGRTPKLNPLGGRDHWPSGFSVALAGGGIAGGRVVGATDPEGTTEPADPVAGRRPPRHGAWRPSASTRPARTCSAVGRPIKLSEGRPIATLLG